MTLVPAGRLRAWATRALDACGLPPDDARLGAETLVRANLRGVDTHGVSRLPVYARLLRERAMNPVCALVVTEMAGVLHVDAGTALGQVAGPRVLTLALERLRSTGACTLVLHRVGHLGALGVLAAMLAEAGMIGLVMQNGPPIMALPGATSPAIGNNPLAFAAPVAGGVPVVVDIATSEVAFGRVIDAARAGATLEPGWALDASGQPTTEAAAALRGGMLSPMAGHKGLGIAMMVEVLAGSLSGMRPAAMQGATLPPAFGGFIYALNPALAGPSSFDSHLYAWLEVYRASGPGMRYPGQRAAATERDREGGGIPLPPVVLAELAQLADALGLDAVA